MTGLEIIRAPGTTAEQIADIVSELLDSRKLS